MAEKTELEVFAPETRAVKIAGGEYAVRELTLSEKIRVLAPLANQLKDAIKGGAETINLEQLLFSSADVLENLLELAVPDLKNLTDLPESETRALLPVVLEVNDFGGFFANFIALAPKIFPSQKP